MNHTLRRLLVPAIFFALGTAAPTGAATPKPIVLRSTSAQTVSGSLVGTQLQFTSQTDPRSQLSAAGHV